MYATTCLQLVEIIVNKVETSVRLPHPTLRAFAGSVAAWLRRLRDIALKEEVRISNSRSSTAPTLLGLASSLSSICSGAEYLLQIVHGAIPQVYFDLNSPFPAADIAVHILDHLYEKLNEVCLVQGGEEEAYQMVLYIFVGSLLPYIEGLDSWVFGGTLDDPYEEMFFYAKKAISIDKAEFWDKSYLFRQIQYQKVDVVTDCVPLTNDKNDMTGGESFSLSSSVKGKDRSDIVLQVCPLFIKGIAKAIVSAGKSLQLIQHTPLTHAAVISGKGNHEIDGFGRSDDNADFSNTHHGQSIAGLTLSEVFCVSFAGLIGHGDHISKNFWQYGPCDSKIMSSLHSFDKNKREEGNSESFPAMTCSEKIWRKFLVDTLLQKTQINSESADKHTNEYLNAKGENIGAGVMDEFPLGRSFFPENLVITVCQRFLHEKRDALSALNVSRSFYLPPLNDEGLRKDIFGGNSGPLLAAKGTNYTFGFQFGEYEHLHSKTDTKMLEVLFPFPTLLLSSQDYLYVSELLPFQKNSTLPSRVLSRIQNVEPKATPLPVAILQECLVFYIKKQVDFAGRHILSKLLYKWRLMAELGVLRAIYLLGSGDLLQHFLTVIFNKLDKGETWDDDFELNTILQESIRNSADGMLQIAPASLVVSITKKHDFSGDEQHNTATLV